MEHNSTEREWRFPDNGHLRVYGFNTSDMETFSQDPIAHFAREICQNSVDARRKDVNEPVRIEFKTFDIHCSHIPGYLGLKEEINKVRNYKSLVGNEDEKQTASSIYNSISGNSLGRIRCLRISDFNTTGLYGASTHSIKQPFYSLAFGTGSCEKPSGSAGSKGIGKYAAFVISESNTVFYSTHAIYPETNNTEDAFIGITKLCSRPIGSDDENFATIGEGCYGISEKNYPIMEQLMLDPDFSRKDDEYGTDLFIVGFSGRDDWKYEIIEEALDSFIVAIINGFLEINIDGIELNIKTLPQFIEQMKAKPNLTVSDKKIIAQYDIFSNKEDESVKKKSVYIKGCEINFYAKTYSKDEKRFATNKCSRIRFPYMKIDDVSINSYAEASAVCIVENNYVHDVLRKTENPQHTVWERKRFKLSNPELYKEVEEILKSLSIELGNFITEVVGVNGGDSTDLEGAGKYLSDDDEGSDDGGNDETPSENDTTIVSIPTRRRSSVRGTGQDSNGGPDSIHSTGEPDENGGTTGTTETGHPHREPKPLPPNPDPHPNPDDIKAWGDGIKPFLKQIISKSIRFRCIKSINDELYEIVFLADSTHEKCDIQLSSVGDSNDTEKVFIKSATIDGKEAIVKSGRIIHLSVEEGKKYRISCRIDREGVFAGKVLMCAYEKKETVNHENKK